MSFTVVRSYKKSTDGFTLKWIAAITMLIDHLAVGLLFPYVKGAQEGLFVLYMVLRGVGRLAFPLYAFLLVEGLIHTHSRIRYLLRLGLFTLISEIPFDLLFSDTVWNGASQNVFFTLTIGFVVIWAVDELLHRLQNLPMLQWGCIALVVVFGMVLAFYWKSDYGAFGVASIAVMYILRGQPGRGMPEAVILLTLASTLELVAVLDVFLVMNYNGRQKNKGEVGRMKWFFYVYYPVHLLVIWLIAWLMG